LAIRARL